MRQRIIPVYNCDHCNKLYQVKSKCARHEELCTRNPANTRACHGCIHLDKKEVTHYFDTFQGEGSRKVSVFFCAAKQICVYPPQITGNKEPLESMEFDNEPMPLECDKKQTDNYL